MSLSAGQVAVLRAVEKGELTHEMITNLTGDFLVCCFEGWVTRNGAEITEAGRAALRALKQEGRG